jgi:hypothetical protein
MELPLKEHRKEEDSPNQRHEVSPLECTEIYELPESGHASYRPARRSGVNLWGIDVLDLSGSGLIAELPVTKSSYGWPNDLKTRN